MFHLRRFIKLSVFVSVLTACGAHQEERFGLGSTGGGERQKQTLREQMITAIGGDDAAKVGQLLSEGYEIDTILLEGGTALHVAVKRNRPKIVRVLFEAKADPDIKDADGKTPRDLAANNPEILAIFSPNVEIELHAEMMKAVRDGDKQKLTELIKAKRDPNFVDEESGETPLTYIIVNRMKSLLRPMLQGDSRTDVNLKNGAGKSPLKIARETGQTDIEKMLLQKGAKEN